MRNTSKLSFATLALLAGFAFATPAAMAMPADNSDSPLHLPDGDSHWQFSRSNETTVTVGRGDATIHGFNFDKDGDSDWVQAGGFERADRKSGNLAEN